MKNLVLAIVTMLFFTNCSNSQKINYQTSSLSGFLKDNLEFIVENLEEDIPNYYYKLSKEKGFNIKDEEIIVGVNIYDLNNGEKIKTNFKNDHIYHISPKNFQDSFSYILGVSENKMTLFKAINCTDRGNSLEEVVEFINARFSSKENLARIIENVKNYRKYGTYLRTDSMTVLKCKCEPCE